MFRGIGGFPAMLLRAALQRASASGTNPNNVGDDAATSSARRPIASHIILLLLSQFLILKPTTNLNPKAVVVRQQTLKIEITASVVSLACRG